MLLKNSASFFMTSMLNLFINNYLMVSVCIHNQRVTKKAMGFGTPNAKRQAEHAKGISQDEDKLSAKLSVFITKER